MRKFTINTLVDDLMLINYDDSLEKQWIEKISNFFSEGGILSEVTNRNGWYLIHLAAANGLTNVVRWLVNNGIDINSRDEFGNTPLILAFDLDIDGAIQNRQNIDFKFSKKLIALGADPLLETNDGYSIKGIALSYGKEIYKLYEQNFIE